MRLEPPSVRIKKGSCGYISYAEHTLNCICWVRPILLFIARISTDPGRSPHCSFESTEHLCRENDKTFITREKVICIIYAVFSTIISNIHDRFFFLSFLMSAPLCFSYLIDGAEINLVSFIYLSTVKLRLKTSVVWFQLSGHSNCALGMTALNVSSVRKIIKYHKFD